MQVVGRGFSGCRQEGKGEGRRFTEYRVSRERGHVFMENMEGNKDNGKVKEKAMGMIVMGIRKKEKIAIRD